jgi:hypothetical protein
MALTEISGLVIGASPEQAGEQREKRGHEGNSTRDLPDISGVQL